MEEIELTDEQQTNADFVQWIIKTNPRVKDRIAKLNGYGFDTVIKPMGSGGVGQVKRMDDGTVRKQICHGWGKWNYSYCVIL